jgi:hypothetical protein
MRHFSVLVVAMLAVVSFGLVGSAPVAAQTDASGCRVFADIPNTPANPTGHAQLYAWAEVHCASTTNVSVRVCAMDMGTAAFVASPKPVWCVQSHMTARAGHRAFAKTRAHPCAVGSRYVSFVSLNGLTTDQGPWVVCRADP